MSCLDVDTCSILGKSNEELVAENLPSNPKRRSRIIKRLIIHLSVGAALGTGLAGLFYLLAR